MTKAATIHNFWSSFGLTAYEENAVPSGDDAPAFPYITYQLTTDSLGSEVPMSGTLWYRSTSWKSANSKADEISSAIGHGGKIVKCDGGRIWIKRGSPFAQNMAEEPDDLIKRKYLNIVVEYFTAN